MAFPTEASSIYRDYVTPGDAGSGAHEPVKSDIRTWSATVESWLSDTVAEFEAKTVPADVDSVYIAGYAAAGDGGHGFWTRAASGARPSVLQTADGAYWELPDDGLCPRQYGTSDDDAAWAALKADVEWLYGQSRWAGGFGRTPGVIDGLNYEYDLTTDLTIQAPVHIKNVRTTQDGCTVKLDGTSGGGTLTHALTDCTFTFVDTADYAGAILSIPNAFGTVLTRVNIRAGAPDAGDSYRARYGLYLGEENAWGCGIMGGRYYGGECPVRIGKNEDHTGNWIGGGVTIDHGGAMNLLLCNPKGFEANGYNIESSNGTRSIVITSETGTVTSGSASTDQATNVRFGPGYMFRLSQETGAYSADNVGIDICPATVPDTSDWDGTGEGLITSENSGQMVEIDGPYIVGDYLDTCVRARVLYGLELDNIVYKHHASGTAFLDVVSGSNGVEYKKTRDQNSGATAPSYVNNSTSLVMANKPYTQWTPVLSDDSATGSTSYTTQEGWYSVTNGICTLNLHIVGTEDTGYSGDMQVALPSGITPYAPHRATNNPYDYGFTTGVDGFVAAGGSAVLLFQEGTNSRLTDAQVPGSPTEYSLHMTLIFPCSLSS